MFSLSHLCCGRNASIESHSYYDEKKPRKISKFWIMLKSCFGCNSIEDNVVKPSRKGYQRAGGPATGFEGQEVYGIQAEYLDDDDMAWGKPRRSRKQARSFA